jgi:hypothetical protein
MNRRWLNVGRSVIALAVTALLITPAWLHAQAESAPPAAEKPAAAGNDSNAAMPAEAPAADANAAQPVGSEPAAEGAAAPAEGATSPAEGAAASAPAGEPGAKDPMEENFASYLHFARVGQFDVADKYAQAFLQLPEFNPMTKESAQKLLALSDRYHNSVETLLLVINNTPIGQNARKVLDLIHEANRQARMAPERIVNNIKLLAGTPVQQSVGLERLVESGEYAVPWMIQTIADPKQQELHPFVIRALPRLGKNAVNPLEQALAIANPAVQGVVAEALGRIGYPQALPYLQRLAADTKTNPQVRSTAEAAIQRIVVSDPRIKRLPAAELFRDLAEQYYANVESLRPSSAEPRANVWFLKDGIITPVEVPLAIYNFVMSMRAAQASLALSLQQPAVVALWLAADMRREAGLGLDVTTEEPAQTLDLTRPADFPRAIYFARTFGPMHCQLALARAVKDLDPVVALGSIAAMNVTAGPVAMVQPQNADAASLAAALRFPDIVVRIRAALALAQATPQATFKGADQVIPVLASAVQLTSSDNYMVIDPDAAIRGRVQEDLGRQGGFVVAADRLGTALDQAHRKVTHLDGIFLATDMRDPTAVEAVRQLASDRSFSLTPIVLIVKGGGGAVAADAVAAVDKRVGRVFVTADAQNLAEQLVARDNEIAPKYGQRELSPELALSLAMEAANTLRLVAVNRSPVFEIAGAEPSMILALGSPSEELRVAAAGALALVNSASAQRAIGSVALAAEQTETMRKAAFSALADSARRFGPKLEGPAMQKLVEVATKEPNLSLRTSASQALGAMNLPGKTSAEILLSDSPM